MPAMAESIGHVLTREKFGAKTPENNTQKYVPYKIRIIVTKNNH
ncbi:hypothetical protein FACS1894102_2160 [Spirochaetia bacterium]|nr:hypothetical protein FACS1894102_2160 [Spirochaetia bacterium]